MLVSGAPTRCLLCTCSVVNEWPCLAEDQTILLEHALWLLSLLVDYEPSDPPRCQRPDDMRFVPGRARIEEKHARQASYPQRAPTTNIQA